MKKGKILAIDYGEKKFGFAISDSKQKMSFPLKILLRKGLKKDIDNIAKLVKQRKIKKIVLGNPLNFEGEESKMSKKVKNFAEELKKELDIEICLYDERFSTIGAENLLRKYGFDNRKMKGKKDSIASSLILSSYLQHKNQEKND